VIVRKNPHPGPLPEYREREKSAGGPDGNYLTLNSGV
jgi:hypothetical protein